MYARQTSRASVTRARTAAGRQETGSQIDAFVDRSIRAHKPRVVARSLRLAGVATLVALAVYFACAQSVLAAPQYSYFPSGATNDGRMLVVAGTGLETLSGTSVSVSFSVANSETQFNIGIFDGESDTDWDSNSGNFGTTYTLYADPLGDGTGTTQIDTWTDADMSANSWTDRLITTSAAAQSPSGNYFYRLYVTATDPGTSALNTFKVRVEGYTYIIPTTIFGYIGATPSNNWTWIYPNYPTLTPTNYDGTWNFWMSVAENSPYVNIWDGDFDAAGDTDDPNSLGVPAFDTGAGLAEGARPGAPADDVGTATYLRTPSVRYSVILPDGTTSYPNVDPSGNTEWELFRLDTTSSDPAVTDHYAATLPSGMYNVRMTGVDMHNLNALRFEHPLFGVDINGRPIPPVAPFMVGDTVYADVDGDGVQDVGEAGIPGVVMTLKDPVSGRIIAAAITDSTGHYGLNSWNGTYRVEVDGCNFAPGGALAGWASTTPDPPSQVKTVWRANVDDADFGFVVPPATGLVVTPDQSASMAPGQQISYRFTVGNHTNSDGVFDLSRTSTLGWGGTIGSIDGSTLTTIALRAGETTEVVVTVSVPASAVDGEEDVTALRATLVGNPSVSSSAHAVTTVLNGLMMAPNGAQSACPSTSVTYRHTITNSWPTTRTISLAASSTYAYRILGSDGSSQITSVTLGPNGASTDVFLEITVPSGAASGTVSAATLTATSGASATVTDTTTVTGFTTYSSSSLNTPQTVFSVGSTVYAMAGGVTQNGTYTMRWYDSTGTRVRTSGTLTRTNNTLWDSYPTVVGSSSTGLWRVVLRRNGTIVRTTYFTVIANAAITHLFATDAPRVNSDSSIGSTVFNSMKGSVLNSTLTYTVWWDSNGDGSFGSGDIYIDSGGAPVSYDGIATVSTHVNTGIDVAGNRAYTDPPWTLNNTNFPNQGSYNVTAVWTDSGGSVIDRKTTHFYSIPALGWPLFGALLMGAAAVGVLRLRRSKKSAEALA
jgi:hypothetical protein